MSDEEQEPEDPFRDIDCAVTETDIIEAYESLGSEALSIDPLVAVKHAAEE